jgi:hypothetical protein
MKRGSTGANPSGPLILCSCFVRTWRCADGELAMNLSPIAVAAGWYCPIAYIWS